MAETGPAAIVAALTRAIADDGRGGGATLGGGAPLCPRRRWSCRRVMPEEELVGVVSAARRTDAHVLRGSHARRSKRGISGGAGCGGGGGARGQVTAVGASGAAAEDARGYDAAALSFPEEASRPRAPRGRVTYSRVVLAVDRSRTGMARKISVRRRRREHGVLVGSWTSTSAAVAVRDAPGRARLTPLLRGSHGCNGSTEQRMGGILGWE
uniref:Uncharacterized protein n=2 Tax=Oryza sativa subsp. japonica TaxID=39947 RepID=Q6YWH0_ORYSJ|nr:hypothetical protein [Oryza sativa Japonica Group]BAD16385.1 hypothetical protein [Oryza sativa Japonica Group]